MDSGSDIEEEFQNNLEDDLSESADILPTPSPPLLSSMPILDNFYDDIASRKLDVVSELKLKHNQHKDNDVLIQRSRWTSLLFVPSKIPGEPPKMEKIVRSTSEYVHKPKEFEIEELNSNQSSDAECFTEEVSYPANRPSTLTVSVDECHQGLNQSAEISSDSISPVRRSALQSLPSSSRESEYAVESPEILPKNGTVASKVLAFNQMPSNVSPVSPERKDVPVHYIKQKDWIRPAFQNEADQTDNADKFPTDQAADTTIQFKDTESPDKQRISDEDKSSISSASTSHEFNPEATFTNLEIIRQQNESGIKMRTTGSNSYRRVQGTVSLIEPPTESYTSGSYSIQPSNEDLTPRGNDRKFLKSGYPLGLPPFSKDSPLYYGALTRSNTGFN